jgi:hypothetical protein
MNLHLNNERQECKTDSVRGELVGGRGNGDGKEGEYGQCTFYTCMKIAH